MAPATIACAKDDPTAEAAEAEAAAAAVIAETPAIVAAARAPDPNIQALEAILAAKERVGDCRLYAVPGNIGDLTSAQLLERRDCVSAAMRRLLEKMLALTALQESGLFDYAVFSETVRLVADAQTPGRTALAPFVAMLRAAEASSIAGERVAVAALQDLAAEAETALAK
ncbi:MAG: hypothetical protein AAFW46_00865 [Pseudomonadota bacterium]